MSGQISIRDAVAEDVPAIIELWKELMDYHKERDTFFSRSATGHERFAQFLADHIKSENSCVFVAADGKDLVGYCVATISAYPPVLERQQYGELFDVAVTKKYRRRGIGQRLVNAVRDWCSNKGIDRIEARYSTANETAEGFWAKVGFKPYLKTTFIET